MEREKMRKGRLRGGCARTAFILFVLGSLYFVYLVWSGFFAFDTCLDQGGVWNFDERECSFTQQRGRGEMPLLWPF